jgi:hypothetical protein
MLSHSFGLLVLGLEVFAQVAEASYSLGNSTGNASTSISETCLTKYGHASLKTILSSTHTDTISSTVYSTVQSTPTVTFTPAPSTFTSISTVFTTLTTTQSTATDTFTSTEISTETTTSVTTQVVTAYTTAYVTQTVQSSTSIAAAAGFTPLGSVYSVATKRKRSNRDRFEEEPKHEEESNEDCTCVDEEEAPEPSTTVKPTTSHAITGAPKPTSTASTSPIKLTCNESGKPVVNTELYPTAVACEKTLLIVGTAIVTRVSNSTATQTAIASSVYTTITAVESVTVTVAPADASTTITEQSTQTSTATITATTTTLLTVTSVTTTVLPTATSYGQCQANNIVSYLNSNPVVEVDLTNGLLASSTATSSTNCCIQCATATGCGGFAYLSGSCFLLKDGNQGTVCNGAVSSWGFATLPGTATSIVIGNGACGQGLFSGSQ